MFNWFWSLTWPWKPKLTNHTIKKSWLHLNVAADHGQLRFFSCFGFKNCLLSCWIDFDVSPDHENPNWPSTLFKKVDYILMLQLTMFSWGFSHILSLRTVSDHVESILMSHLTMETPTDHLQNTRSGLPSVRAIRDRGGYWGLGSRERE